MILLTSILLPLFTMLLSLLIKRNGVKKRMVQFMGTINFLWALILIPIIQSEGIMVVQIGGWSKSLGTTLVADKFSVFMLLISAFIFFIVTIYSSQTVKKTKRRSGFFFFSSAILMGVNGSFIAGDILNLYLWLEVALTSSFILATIGEKRSKQKKSINYILIHLMGTFFILSAIGFIYGKLGTLNMASLSYQISHIEEIEAVATGLILFFAGITLKGLVLPFFFWLPSSYYNPAPLTTLYSGLLSNVSFYVIIRFFTLFLHHDLPFWSLLLFWIGGISMIVGVVAASGQKDFHKMISFHIIGQIGFVLIPLAFNTTAGLTAALFFIAHKVITRTNIFLVSGWVYKNIGILSINSLRLTFNKSRIWRMLFFISIFSLAGFPPLSGFIGKYLVLKAGIASNHIAISLLALLAALITLFSMVKVWLKVFWEPAWNQTTNHPPLKVKEQWSLFSSVALAIVIVGMGVLAQPIINYCEAAATDLTNSAQYIFHVLENFNQ